MIDHCVDCWNEEQEEKTYKAYVTDVLQLICENVAQSIPKGSYITAKWRELATDKPKDERSADEIAADVILHAGLSFGGDTV